MTLTITVVPASTRAGRETIRVLLTDGSRPVVHGIYRDPSKAPPEFLRHANFKASQGDVGSGAGLDFGAADAVLYIPPVTYDGTDQGEWATRTATHVRDALRDAPSVRRLVLFSAVGAQHDHGTGILRLNHISEKILADAAPEVLIIRPGYFQEEFAVAFEAALKSDPPVLQSWITPTDHKIPMVSLHDISRTCASNLLKPSTDNPRHTPSYIKLFGPRHYSSADLRDAAEQASGKQIQLELVERDRLATYFSEQGQVPPAHVDDFVGLAAAVLPGGVITGDFGYDEGEGTVRGQVELAETFAQVYAEFVGRK